jgi:hypothetical protein
MDRVNNCQQLQNDLDEAIRAVIEKHKPTYSELFFALLSVHRSWADMMLEDENDGIMVCPVQEISGDLERDKKFYDNLKKEFDLSNTITPLRRRRFFNE